MAVMLSAPQRDWLAGLYEEHATTVFQLCRRILRDPEEASDATHEVFLKVAQSLERQPTENMRPWLLIVTRNYCFDVLRRQKRADRAVATLGRLESSGTIDPEGAAIRRHTLQRVLDQLTPRERKVLWQSAVEQLGPAGIAQTLRVNYMAAAQVVSRARKHAALIAAAVAAILVSFRPDRIARRIGLVSTRLAAATAIPIVALTLQPSSSAPPAYPAIPGRPITANGPSHPIVMPNSHHPILSPLAENGHAASPAVPTIGLNPPALPVSSGLDGVARVLPTPSLPAVPVPTPTLPSVPVVATPPPHR